jgi:DNA-binding PadR family transcriptional regulator
MREKELIMENVAMEILRVLNNPLRSKILVKLREANHLLSYTEIIDRCILKENGKLENEGWICHNLKLLRNKGFIIRVEKHQRKTSNGKPRTSFYQLTKKGTLAANFLLYLLKAVKKYIDDMSVDMSFFFYVSLKLLKKYMQEVLFY